MAQIGPRTSRGVINAAQALGDVTSIRSTKKLTQRGRSRIIGRIAGKGQAGLGIFGLAAWAQFFNWLTNAIKREAAEPTYIGTVDATAAGYELGFTNTPQNPKLEENWGPPGIKFLQQGVEFAQAQMKGTPAKLPSSIKPDRSGIYSGHKLMADIRTMTRGDFAHRAVRRAAGRETTRFFWGALSNPDANVLESFARNIVRFSRAVLDDSRLNVDGSTGWSKGGLRASITWADSKDRLAEKSENAIRRELGDDPSVERKIGELVERDMVT